MTPAARLSRIENIKAELSALSELLPLVEELHSIITGEFATLDGRRLDRAAYARYFSLKEAREQLELCNPALGFTEPRVDSLCNSPQWARAEMFLRPIGLGRLRQRLEQGRAELKELEAAGENWPRPFTYTGPRLKTQIPAGHDVEPGEICWLSEHQAEAFGDRFEPAGEDDVLRDENARLSAQEEAR